SIHPRSRLRTSSPRPRTRRSGAPRSALILCRDQHAKRIDSNVFPGQQGGPLMHAIAAKAVTLKLADTPEFRDRQLRTLQGAQTLAHRLLEPDATRAGIGCRPFVIEGDAEGVNCLAGGVDVSRYRVRYRVWCGHQASPSAA